MWRGPAWVTVLRDVLLLVLPGAAFIWEAVKDKPSAELLIIYMALLAFPGLAGAIFLARHGGMEGGLGGIEPPSPPSAPPLSQPPPSSSSSSSPGG